MATYPTEVETLANSKIPKGLLEDLSKYGWNIFGIYEVVKEAIKLQKKLAKASMPD